MRPASRARPLRDSRSEGYGWTGTWHTPFVGFQNPRSRMQSVCDEYTSTDDGLEVTYVVDGDADGYAVPGTYTVVPGAVAVFGT